ncbi:MAG: lipoyl(octanoyl) transferase LipB [Armatimonadota bacterium]|nr:lipoyl(octanoyl) transferase LipB [Armatimonadota bacterium]
MRSVAWLLDLDDGPRPYAEIWALQRALVRARQADRIPDVLILLEHAPVLTLGRSAEDAHLLVPRERLADWGIEVYDVERGGSVTYHGPGQLVGYPILDLCRLDEDIGRFMRTLEGTVIDTLAGFGITAGRRPGYPGVWVGDAKIAAMGVAVKRRVTMHGFALNVTTDLDAYRVINPCGLGLPVTSMAAVLGRAVDLGEVRRAYAARFAAAFRISLERMSLPAVAAALSAVEAASREQVSAGA